MSTKYEKFPQIPKEETAYYKMGKKLHKRKYPQHSPSSVTREVQIKSTPLYCVTQPPPPPVAHRKADGLTGECGRGSRSWLCWGGGCGCKLAQPLSYPLKLTPHTSQLWTYYVTPQQPLKTYSNTTGQSNWKTLNCQVTHGRKGKKEKTEKWNTVGTQTENYK